MKGLKRTLLLILAFIIALCLSNSCTTSIGSTGKIGDEYTHPNVSLVVIEFNGEKHEYVYYSASSLGGYSEGSLSHWEGCKYCKHNK